MPLTGKERKAQLGYGALSEVARKTKRTLGHVSQVVSGTRRDKKVEREVARRLGITIEDAFGYIESRNSFATETSSSSSAA
jgi:hypothetical protein